MKYTAKETNNGKWVVAQGYKIKSISYDTKAEAHEQAIIESMIWHKLQDRKLWLLLSKGEDYATLIDGTHADHGDFFV